jgi:hypothetical protein
MHEKWGFLLAVFLWSLERVLIKFNYELREGIRHS